MMPKLAKLYKMLMLFKLAIKNNNSKYNVKNKLQAIYVSGIVLTTTSFQTNYSSFKFKEIS